jgi:hypothetical protein
MYLSGLIRFSNRFAGLHFALLSGSVIHLEVVNFQWTTEWMYRGFWVSFDFGGLFFVLCLLVVLTSWEV